MSKRTSKNPFGFWKLILLLIMAGTVVLSLSPVSADTGVTLVAQGDHSYYLGEKVVFSGKNSDSGSTYLFITGPETFVDGPGIPGVGGNLTSPLRPVASGNPDTFTVVKTKPDKTWEYTWYTANLPFDAGTYTVYAVSQPKAADQPGSDAASVGIIVKKPFITAELSPAPVSKGQPFTVRGVAEGMPPEVHVWIIGKNYSSDKTVSVKADNATFTYEVPREVTSHLAGGQYFAVVQHPMADNRFDFVVTGDYVRQENLNNGTNLFRISGPGSLQGSDAADALITAISDQESNDRSSYTHDTYVIVPFQVTDAGPVSGASADTGVTLAAQGDRSYYLGEKVVFSGKNPDSDTTYLFMTGPETFMNRTGIPGVGGNLTSPLQPVVSGNPDSFTVVKTRPDKTWEYVYYTANLPVDAGSYTIYAVSQPDAYDRQGPDAANVKIILKKPFITAEITPSPIIRGQPFNVSGFAEGNPETVQIWILGENTFSTSRTSVSSDASFRYVVPPEITGQLTGGQYFVLVQHPMQNITFDIDRSGDYVSSLQPGTNLFRIAGPGSLQGNDAADALIAAFSDPGNGDDTYTEIPFTVADAESPAPRATVAATPPVPDSLFGGLEKALRSLF